MKTVEKEEYCWSCGIDKPISKFEKKDDYTKGICKSCIARQRRRLKKAGLTVTERNRAPHFSEWHCEDIILTDVFLLNKNGKEYFIRAYKKRELPYDTKVFGWINQFIDTDGNYIADYGGKSPFALLDYMKNNNCHFGKGYRCSLKYLEHTGIWEFHGNLEEVSNAFSFRIYKKEYARSLAKALNGRKHITVRLS